MLLQLGTVGFDTSDIKLFTQVERDGQPCLRVHLTTQKDGLSVVLEKEPAEKLLNFLRATGLVDLNGPAYQSEAFNIAADLNATLHARQALRQVILLKAQLDAAEAALGAAQSALQAKVDGGAQRKAAPTEPAPQPPALTLVPPRPPINLDLDEPDPMQFISRGPRRSTLPPQFSDL